VTTTTTPAPRLRRLKRKLISNSGFSTSLDGLREINDQGGEFDTVPRSPTTKDLSNTLAFSNTRGPGSVVESPDRGLNIADGNRRPGW
jgi:hypothetical protein